MAAERFQSRAENEPFRLGRLRTTLQSVLRSFFLEKIGSKFKLVPDDELFVASRELVRYLYLVAHAPHGVFFVGNGLIDDLWHALIIETREYRLFCERLRPGSFLEHSGLKFEDYLRQKPAKEIRDEQLSWLASYFHNFGPLDDATYASLALPTNLVERLGVNEVQGLNAFASELFKRSRQLSEQENSLTLDQYLETVVKPRANELDRDPTQVGEAIVEIFSILRVGQSEKQDGPLLMTNDELENTFAASPTLAFTIWQHFAAVERLSHSSVWKKSQPELWKKLCWGEVLVGLATTHLLRKDPELVQAEFGGEKVRLGGRAPWASGHGFFEKIVVGFRQGSNLLFCVTDFPRPEISIEQVPGIEARKIQLAAFNGTSSVSLMFRSHEISLTDLLQEVDINGELLAPVVPRPASRYVTPELGMVRAVIDDLASSQANAPEEKSAELAGLVRHLSQKCEALRVRRDRLGQDPNAGEEGDAIRFEAHQLVRSAVQAQALMAGGSSLKENSTIARRQLELLWLDAVPQGPELLGRKLRNVRE